MLSNDCLRTGLYAPGFSIDSRRRSRSTRPDGRLPAEVRVVGSGVISSRFDARRFAVRFLQAAVRLPCICILLSHTPGCGAEAVFMNYLRRVVLSDINGDVVVAPVCVVTNLREVRWNNPPSSCSVCISLGGSCRSPSRRNGRRLATLRQDRRDARPAAEGSRRAAADAGGSEHVRPGHRDPGLRRFSDVGSPL